MSVPKAEITWSLMHPTPINVEYMKKVIAIAPRYRVDSFELCADCHTNHGGLDGLADYREYPVTYSKIDHPVHDANREALREVLKLAHSIGKPVYYWHREAMVLDGLLQDRPGLLDENGEFDLFGKDYAELLRYKIDSTFRNVPELDGLVLTLTEASYSVIHNSNTEKYPPCKVVEHIVRLFASELAKRGKRLILRSFGSIAQDYEDIIGGAEPVAKKYGFEIETKITPYDFDPFLPVNPFLHSVPGAMLGAECDCLGEFLGAGYLPAENVDNIVKYVRSGQAAGVNRYAIRCDRIGHNVFDCYEINLYAYARAIDDPNVTAEQIREEFYAKHAPASARRTLIELSTQGFRVVEKNNFIDGNVIFHQFPLAHNLKFAKAGFIFALFSNNADLHNGEGVWSILCRNKTPGRAAILREKDEAVALADDGLAKLDKLDGTGFEAEFAMRRELWYNATVVTRAFRALVQCVCAYFDDMEARDAAAARLNAAVVKAKALFAELAKAALSKENGKQQNCNGLEVTGLFRVGSSLENDYLAPLTTVCDLLLEEFRVEFADRLEYGKECCDCIVCGSITDEVRIARYMHAAHAMIDNGHLFRWAGNTTFPNGYLEMELKRSVGGGTLKIFGDIAETRDFALTVDGEKRNCRFDENGCFTMPLISGAEKIQIRLEKSGSSYPRFRAVTVCP